MKNRALAQPNPANKSVGPPENRAHHNTLNMSSHMISARQQQPGQTNSSNQVHQGGISSERGPLGQSQQEAGGPQGIHLNKKFSGHNRKRNAREKSYDLYN